jgi:hypothetical protein
MSITSADVNAQDLFGSALQVASRQGHLKVVELILRREAKVNYDKEPYGNALIAASA